MTSSRFCTKLIMPVVAGILAFGCAGDRAVDPVQPAFSVSTAPGQAKRSAEGATDSLAKALALALGDGGTRARLRDDLRDSPFRSHALHVASYLRGKDGAAVATKAAGALGITADALLSMSESVPNLELVIPRSLDRIAWDGGAEIDVIATPATAKQRLEEKRVSERGYNVRGSKVEVSTVQYSPRPSIAIRPAEYTFPADPERVRAAAPKQARSTVSTPSEERAELIQLGKEKVAKEKVAGPKSTSGFMLDGAMTIIPCEPACGGSGGPTPPGVGGGGAILPSAMTKNYCYGISPVLNATTDRDNDRIRDDCELALASSLSPLHNIGLWEDWWARQPYWSVSRHPDRPGNIQIMYAIAYLDDGGDFGTGIGSHVGDSEFIILEVINSTGTTWGVRYATLSAHFQWWHDDTSTYYYDDLEYPGGAYPRIWASLAKHGNYRNRAACEGSFFATCQGDYFGFRIPVASNHNLGNWYNLPEVSRNGATQLVNCTYYETFPQFDRTGNECFWSDGYFSGWDVMDSLGVTPYREIFQIFGF